MNSTCRYHRNFLWFGGVYLIAAVAMATAGIVASHDRSISSPLGAAAMFASFSLLAAAIGVYLILACKRHRLVVTDSCVESQGVWRTRRIAFVDVRTARWRPSRLTLSTASGKLAIDLSNYGGETQRTLIRFFRLRLPRNAQHGWDAFWRMHWGLFDLPDDSEADGQTAAIRHSRRGTDLCFLYGTFLTLATPLALWLSTGERRALGTLLLLLPLAGLWRWLRWSARRPGKIRATLEPTRQHHPAELTGLVLFAIALPATIALLPHDSQRGLCKAAMIALGVAYALICIGSVCQERRRRQYLQQQGIDLPRLAEEAYMRSSTQTDR